MYARGRVVNDISDVLGAFLWELESSRSKVCQKVKEMVERVTGV